MRGALFAREIVGHGFAQRCRDVEEFLLAGGAPRREQPADDDAGVKEAGGGGRIDFEGYGAGLGIPGLAGEKTRGAEGRQEPLLVPGKSVQIDQRGYEIARNLGGNREVALEIGAVIAGHAAIRFLNARAQKPLPGASEMWRQIASVTLRLRPGWARRTGTGGDFRREAAPERAGRSSLG